MTADGTCTAIGSGGGSSAYPGDIFVNNESGDRINGKLEFGGSQTYVKRYNNQLLLSGRDGVILGRNAVDSR